MGRIEAACSTASTNCKGSKDEGSASRTREITSKTLRQRSGHSRIWHGPDLVWLANRCDCFALLNAFIDSALAEVGRAELAAWLILYRHAKPDGTVTASVGDLARRAGCTGRTMQTALAKLQSRGLVLRLKRGTLIGGPSIWRLLTPEPSGTTGKRLPVTTGKRLPV